MAKPIQTTFKRKEKKYIISVDKLDAIMRDLRQYIVEDDYPTSSISSLYYDTPNFDMIQDALAKKNGREKIRVRSYDDCLGESNPVFLEIKKKDADGIGHKFRMMAKSHLIYQLLTEGQIDESITDQSLLTEIHSLRSRYKDLQPRIYIHYARTSFKEKHTQKGYSASTVRLTIDKNVVYRDLSGQSENQPLLPSEYVIVEIKTPGHQPIWLQSILEKHAIQSQKFSKYGTAYRKSQGILGGELHEVVLL